MRTSSGCTEQKNGQAFVFGYWPESVKGDKKRPTLKRRRKKEQRKWQKQKKRKKEACTYIKNKRRGVRGESCGMIYKRKKASLAFVKTAEA